MVVQSTHHVSKGLGILHLPELGGRCMGIYYSCLKYVIVFKIYFHFLKFRQKTGTEQFP